MGVAKVLEGRPITCHRCGSGSAGLRKEEEGRYVCHPCWDKEHGITRKPSPGRPVLCPECGAELMNRRRGGRISITKVRLKGRVAILECDCGFKKQIKNPFGGGTRPSRGGRGK